MSVYDANRLPYKLIHQHNDPLCVKVKCSRCSKEYVRKISELMVSPVNTCNCNNITNTFNPYYMDYRILVLKDWNTSKSANEFGRRKQLEKYIKQAYGSTA